MNNSINFRSSMPGRTPQSITIIGPTKNYKDRIDVKFDDTTVSFPKKTTLEDLLKSIDMMKNTYVGNLKSLKLENLIKYMYG